MLTAEDMKARMHDEYWVEKNLYIIHKQLNEADPMSGNIVFDVSQIPDSKQKVVLLNVKQKMLEQGFNVKDYNDVRSFKKGLLISWEG